MITDSIQARRARHAGFTLPEAVMALVLLGMAAAGVLVPFGGGASAQAEGWHKTLAAKLADDLLERIIGTPFDQIIPVWAGYTEAQGQVRDAEGAIFTDPIYAHFGREAVCNYVYVPQETGMATPRFILVTVQVQYQGRVVTSINRLISG
jgi:prepilin-type N-terminal cleavage/methylation domain-containing protein